MILRKIDLRNLSKIKYKFKQFQNINFGKLIDSRSKKSFEIDAIIREQVEELKQSKNLTKATQNIGQPYELRSFF